MSVKLESVFKKNTNIVIGAIHFLPLLGYPDFPGFDIALDNALADLEAFEDGGVDAVIIENNYDVPHKSQVGPEVVTSLMYLGQRIKAATSLPVGISVLWNDYRTALSISKVLNLSFIRVPVFIDTVKTAYGIIEGNPEDVISFREHVGAENIAIFTDIHVKHSEILSRHDIIESAEMAIKKGSDAVIITGKWTGDAPDVNKLESLRKKVGDFPIICGSGVDEKNIKSLFSFANGAIVSTSVKSGKNSAVEVNLKPYSERINEKKVKNLVDSI